MSGPVGRVGHGIAGLGDSFDVVVVGLGVTGAGCALDAATRGLSVLAVDSHDVAFGTSRWSSKMVHGGLRYLAKGQVGVAHESAVERGILMETTAPHLTHPMAMLIPLNASIGHAQAGLSGLGLIAGDLLRRGAHTDSETLPRPRRLDATETLALAPGLRPDGLRGGLLSWDGQLEDDARLVLTMARTAAQHGAVVRTKVRVTAVAGTGDGGTENGGTENGGAAVLTLVDSLTGEEIFIRAAAVVNATGVWASTLAPEVRLRPSRGTHLVLRADVLPGLKATVTVPVPGSLNRFVMVLPQPDGTLYVGLTDEPVEGPIPDVPEPSEAEIGFLLDVVSAAFSRPLRRTDVVGAFAGLRPLLESAGETDLQSSSADLSRRHAVLTGTDGRERVVTVVGGKLTTYRQMAQDAVDVAVRVGHLDARPCRTHRLPLTGAAPRSELALIEAPARLVRRFGTDAALVLSTAKQVSGLDDEELLAPATAQVPVTLAELLFGVTHEGAVDVADLLDRRTRVGLIAEDRAACIPIAERALALVTGARGLGRPL